MSGRAAAGFGGSLEEAELSRPEEEGMAEKGLEKLGAAAGSWEDGGKVSGGEFKSVSALRLEEEPMQERYVDDWADSDESLEPECFKVCTGGGGLSGDARAPPGRPRGALSPRSLPTGECAPKTGVSSMLVLLLLLLPALRVTAASPGCWFCCAAPHDCPFGKVS